MGKLSLHPGVWTGSAGLWLGGGAGVMSAPENASALTAIGWTSIGLGVALAFWGLKYQEKHWWVGIPEWVTTHVSWRFRLTAPYGKTASEAVKMPDITVNQLIVRIMHSNFGSDVDPSSPDYVKLARNIGQEIGDQMSLRELSTWMRIGGTLRPVSHNVSKKGVYPLGIRESAVRDVLAPAALTPDGTSAA